MFSLHPRLEHDCIQVGEFDLCRLLLMGDSRYPWFILVPARSEVSEIHQLAEADRQQLMVESCALAEGLAKGFRPDKLNIAAIGNLVPQLHVHHVVRYVGDDAWPAPVWGRLPAIPYTDEKLEKVIFRLTAGRLSGFKAYD
jgi:diadenosine tetraphosphate (Ap4A) HIT family hydrolase